MLDIKFLRENPDVVKQNIKNKFQDDKLPLVDEVIALDAEARKTQQEADELRASRKKISKEIGALMGQGKKEEAEAKKQEVNKNAARLEELAAKEKELQAKVREIMLVIPNIIDPSVPIGKDDSENVEIKRYGEPVVPDYEIPYHAQIMESFDGLDIDAAGKVAGNGCQTAFCCTCLCKRFYDRSWFHLLHSAIHDPKQCRDRCYEFCGNGCDDVQDRGRRSVPDRYK